MTTSGMTTMEIKKINRHNIYTYIYEQQTVSKQGIVEALHLSLSTVTQNLMLLESEGLIERQGHYESTGGRKAKRIEIVKNAWVTIGIGILKDIVHLAAVDLYGNVIKSSHTPLSFHAENEYYQQLGELVSSFIEGETWSKEHLLGAGIAIQGIISADGSSVSYGPILNNTGLELADLARYLPCPARLFHDSKATAWAEMWQQKTLDNAVVLLLNDNMGGALILNKQIHCGQQMYGGLIEHMSLSPDGPLCYCGSRGCLETYLSADSLKEKAGCNLNVFFKNLRENDEKCKMIWDSYLQTLAFAIRNLKVLTDADVIISGLMNDYMIPEDFKLLVEKVQSLSSFPIQDNSLIAGHHGPLAPAIGSALFFIKDWLEKV